MSVAGDVVGFLEQSQRTTRAKKTRRKTYLGKAETTAASRAYAIVHVRHRRVIDAPMSFFAGMGAKFGDDDSDDGGGIQQR